VCCSAGIQRGRLAQSCYNKVGSELGWTPLQGVQPWAGDCNPLVGRFGSLDHYVTTLWMNLALPPMGGKGSVQANALWSRPVKEEGSNGLKNVLPQFLPGVPLGKDVLRETLRAEAAIFFLDDLEHEFPHTVTIVSKTQSRLHGGNTAPPIPHQWREEKP